MDHLHPRVLLGNGRMIRVRYTAYHKTLFDNAGGMHDVPVMGYTDFCNEDKLAEAIEEMQMDIYDISYIEYLDAVD